MVFVFRMDWPDRIFGRFSPPRGIQSFRMSFPRSFNTTGAHRLVTNVTHWSWAFELAKYNHKMSTRNGKLCEGDCHTVFNSPDKEQTYAIFAYSCWFSSDKRIYKGNFWQLMLMLGPVSVDLRTSASLWGSGIEPFQVPELWSSEVKRWQIDASTQTGPTIDAWKTWKNCPSTNYQDFLWRFANWVFFPGCIFLAVPGLMAVYMYIYIWYIYTSYPLVN